MFDIVVGRNERDKKKFGSEGTIFLGRHYVKMGQVTSLSNKVYMDMLRAHVVFICGKRGGGKSYTMGVIAEGMATMPKEISQNLSIILLDTMGIYWTMKYPNHKDEKIIDEWGLESKGLDVKIYTPAGFFDKFKEEGIPTDHPFTIKPSELNPDEWCLTFDISPTSAIGTLISRTINKLRDANQEYSIDEILEILHKDDRAEQSVKDAAENMFIDTLTWGLFSKNGTSLSELAAPGQVTVLDVSCYSMLANSWKIKSLVIGLVSEKLFVQRMSARKIEEYNDVHQALNYYSNDDTEKQEMPLVWLVVDEAHEFLPKDGKTMATDPLVTILREGRQPGISLVLATQQPGKIHTDVMTQSDTVISHRITTKIDIDALSMLMQSYMREDLNTILDNLPRIKGAALVFDDTNEKMYPVQIRPRFTWHGGESPTAFHKKEKKMF
ncbi:ATP-binding protein [Candidatus Woesearchaeota archaeon]|nr:ATP-binding protein [Candidatus Woesearchaeota archaeon]